MKKLFKNKTLIFLILVLVIASFFRLWKLNEIPPGLYPDVAINGNQAITEPGKIFYPENNGREGLMMWLITLSFSIFGVSIWSIKIVAAIIGILTVFGLYLLTKELFSQIVKQSNGQIVALLSSFFLAISFWHTNFSRIGFRAILVPFILVFGFYFLFRGFRTKKIYNLIISGIFFALGFYTYISYRFIVLLLPLILLCWYFIYRKEKEIKKFFLFTIYCLIVAGIFALPIGLYFLQNPHDFASRATQVSVFDAENSFKEFGKSLILHLGMFNFYGDSNWRHNISDQPVLFWPIGIFFLIGLIYSIWKILKFFKHRNWSLIIGYWLLIIWFFIMLLPGILTSEGIPHSLRTIGAIPPIFIFAGLGAVISWEKTKEIFKLKGKFGRQIIIFSTVLMLITLVFGEYYRYFVIWGKNPEVKGAFTTHYVEIGNYLNSFSPETKKYVIVSPLPMPAQTPMFIERTKFKEPQAIYLLPEEIGKIKIEGKTAIILMKCDENLLIELSKNFPFGKIQEKNNICSYEF